MRHLILTTAAILVIAGAATTSASAKTKHHHHAAAPVAAESGAAPADSMSAHDSYMRNERDAGYDTHKDLDAAGNMRQN